MSAPSPTEILAQLKAFNSNAAIDPSSLDPVLRKEIHNASRRLAYAFEEPITAVFRLTMGNAAESAAAKVALDIGLLPLLAKGGEPKTLAALADASATDPVLLLRVLRLLATFGIVVEHGGTKYSLSRTYALLGDGAYADALSVCLGLTDSMLQAVPGLIKENGRRNPEDRFNGAAQKVFNAPGKEMFSILKDMGPDVVNAFSVFLGGASKQSAKVYDVYPIQERLIDGFPHENDQAMWVDVGGGIGQYTLDLKAAFPAIPGRFIVEDMAPVVEVAKAKGYDMQAEFLPHDFFTEQPIRDARAYYIRQCLHNWQDAYCKTILEHIGDAMQPGFSRLLIHEIVIPETDANVWEVLQDWLMMAGYSTLERSEKQWQELIESAGLKINKIYSKATSNESIIEVIKQ